MTRFTIPGRLPGLNEIVAKARHNRFAGATQKKKATRECAKAIVAARVPIFVSPVAVAFYWYEPNNRRDIDNISAGAKFVLDALVETGRIPNDSRRWVRTIAHHFPVADPKNPRVEVEVGAEISDSPGGTQ